MHVYIYTCKKCARVWTYDNIHFHVHIHVHIHTYIRVHASMRALHTYMHACMIGTCMHACLLACMHYIHACMHICMHACMHVCMSASMHVCIHICMQACMYAYTYKHTSIHTYTHIHIQTWRDAAFAFAAALACHKKKTWKKIPLVRDAHVGNTHCSKAKPFSKRRQPSMRPTYSHYCALLYHHIRTMIIFQVCLICIPYMSHIQPLWRPIKLSW